jgi:hypothetical protein
VSPAIHHWHLRCKDKAGMIQEMGMREHAAARWSSNECPFSLLCVYLSFRGSVSTHSCYEIPCKRRWNNNEKFSPSNRSDEMSDGSGMSIAASAGNCFTGSANNNDNENRSRLFVHGHVWHEAHMFMCSCHSCPFW